MGSAPILVVDDDEDTLEAFVHLLEAEGHRALGAPDVRSALAALERSAPRAVLLDWWLGDGTGAAVLDAVRARPVSRQPFVVVVSGASPRDADLAPKLAAADAVLRKPFDFGALLSLLDAAHARRERLTG
jgi:DNA-binding response OmpR family regulator